MLRALQVLTLHFVLKYACAFSQHSQSLWTSWRPSSRMMQMLLICMRRGLQQRLQASGTSFTACCRGSST